MLKAQWGVPQGLVRLPPTLCNPVYRITVVSIGVVNPIQSIQVQREKWTHSYTVLLHLSALVSFWHLPQTSPWMNKPGRTTIPCQSVVCYVWRLVPSTFFPQYRPPFPLLPPSQHTLFARTVFFHSSVMRVFSVGCPVPFPVFGQKMQSLLLKLSRRELLSFLIRNWWTTSALISLVTSLMIVKVHFEVQSMKPTPPPLYYFNDALYGGAYSYSRKR